VDVLSVVRHPQPPPSTKPAVGSFGKFVVSEVHWPKVPSRVPHTAGGAQLSTWPTTWQPPTHIDAATSQTWLRPQSVSALHPVHVPFVHMLLRHSEGSLHDCPEGFPQSESSAKQTLERHSAFDPSQG
jgi:hypothetical protein